MSEGMTRFPMGKYGIKVDPRGAHVTWQYGERTYLGEVTGCYYDAVTCTTRLRVRHFNGEAWKHDPPACMVNVLVREYEREPT